MKKLFFTILFINTLILQAQDQSNQSFLGGKCVSGDCNMGYGVKEYKDGTIYIGEWWNNEPSGKGTLVLSDGTIYVGQFQKGSYNGDGTLMNNNTLYIGEFSNDNPHGTGTIFYSNGNMYVGNFKKGQLHGSGFLQHNDKTIEEGDWKNGTRSGDVIFQTNGYIKRQKE